MKKLMPRRGYLRIGLLIVLALAIAGGVAAFLWLGGKNKAQAGTEAHEAAPAEENVQIPVKAVHPRYGKSFTMSVRRPADVDPYYWTDLKSEVPGKIKMIVKDKGNRITAGEVLVELDVPDLVQLVNEKTAMVTEAKNALELAKDNVETAESAVAIARNAVELRKKDVEKVGHTVWYRDRYLARLRVLLEKGTVDQGVVDEADRNLRAAQTEQEVARLSVDKAKLEVEDAKAKLKAAQANVNVKKALVEVAKGDLAYANAKREFGYIRAPYDGVIVDRNVNVGPGSFVQNASNGQQGTPLLSVIRDDIVTVAMRLPDKYVSFINPGTEAIITTDVLPGVKIHGKITRYAPSLVNKQHDRTMLVEVELWNGSAESYKAFAAKIKQEFQKAKAEGKPFTALKMGSYDPNTGDLLVCLPKVEGGKKLASARQLFSGMFVQMTLVLQQFDNVRLLPTSAIVTEGGYPYIYMVRDGKAHLKAVKVQVDDGKLAKVELLNDNREVVGDLTGQEEVIITGQGELSEGAPVKVTVVDDWSKVAAAK